jgi:hypothetical protein
LISWLIFHQGHANFLDVLVDNLDFDDADETESVKSNSSANRSKDIATDKADHFEHLEELEEDSESQESDDYSTESDDYSDSDDSEPNSLVRTASHTGEDYFGRRETVIRIEDTGAGIRSHNVTEDDSEVAADFAFPSSLEPIAAADQDRGMLSLLETPQTTAEAVKI